MSRNFYLLTFLLQGKNVIQSAVRAKFLHLTPDEKAIKEEEASRARISRSGNISTDHS